eukprot:1686865-Prymnesium_polylepis.2
MCHHTSARHLVPAVGPVLRAAEAEELEHHLDHEDDGDHGRRILEARRVALAHARVRHAHERQ